MHINALVLCVVNRVVNIYTHGIDMRQRKGLKSIKEWHQKEVREIQVLPTERDQQVERDQATERIQTVE